MLSVNSHHSVEALVSEYGSGLHNLRPKGNIETSIEWFKLLQTHVFQNHSRVCYISVSRGNSPSLVMPLRLERRRLVKAVMPLANYYTSYFSPLYSGQFEPSLLRNVLTEASHKHNKAHVMRFAPMDPDSPVFNGFLRELSGIGWRPLEFFCFGNWFLDVVFDWEGYLKTRSANLRSTLKRMTKKFVNDGGCFEIHANLERIEEAIAAYQDVYRSSWKKPEPFPEFVPSLIRLLASRGMLRLGIARLNGKSIAAQLWLVGTDKASIFKVAYNEEFKNYSPGTILTGYLMKYVIDQDRVKEVDFLIGDDKYKKIWMNGRRERWGIVAYNPRTIIGLGLFARECLCRAVKPVFEKFQRSKT